MKGKVVQYTNSYGKLVELLATWIGSIAVGLAIIFAAVSIV
jgi:hypothetical protein